MAVITPNTDVILLKVPLEMDEVNQLTFASKTAQYNYFNSLPKYVIEEGDFTYQRKDNTIRFPAQYDDILQYNYVMYKNTNYSDKWFYAYIVGIEYLNDNVTAIAIKTDVWQTWQFDLTYKPVFVEREHVNDDTFGLHTVPENLETGEYVKNSATGTGTLLSGLTMWYAIGLSEIVGSLSAQPTSYINGMPQGLFYVFTDSTAILHGIVDIYDHAGKAEAIYTMFIFPQALVENGTSHDYQSATWDYQDQTWGTTIAQGLYVPTSSSTVKTLLSGTTVSVPTKIGLTYTPKNNKLKCYPFCYFNVSNNAGSVVEYHYEDFSSAPTFNIDGVFSVGCSLKMYPTNYKNMNTFTGATQDNPYDYGVNGGKYPTLSWRSDSFTNWITQNAINMNASVISSTIGGITSGSFGGVGSMITGGLLSGGMAVFNNIAKTMEASRMPDQARGNLNSGDINFSKFKSGFTIFPLSIKPEYAVIIDNYFSAYGYKVNTIKIPNITGRRNWNYVKTIGCYIDADIPQTDLDEIKGMFDRGITFWHNPTTFADYTQNNDII